MLSFRPIRHSVAHRGFRWSQETTPASGQFALDRARVESVFASGEGNEREYGFVIPADYGRGARLGRQHEFAAWLLLRAKTFSGAMPESFELFLVNL